MILKKPFKILLLLASIMTVAACGSNSSSSNSTNNTPENSVPNAQSVDEDTPLIFSAASNNQISVNDADSNLNAVQISVNNGTLTLATLSGSALISAGANNSDSLTISGSQADINASLATITYQGLSDYFGSDTLSIVSTDSTALSDTATIAITVNAVNDPPVNTVPGAQSVNEDMPLMFNAVNNNRISIGDDLTSSQLSVANGTLSIMLSGFASISAGANNSASLTITGTQFDINMSLATIIYQGSANFNGVDTLMVVSTDGAALNDTDTVNITVNAVDDPTTITGDITGSGAEDGGAIIGDLDATDADGLTDNTYFTVTTDASNGAASINAMTGTWTYTPAANYNGADSFTVTVTDDQGGTETQLINLTITAVNDPTTITGDTTGSGAEDGGVISGDLDATDADGLTDNTYFTVTTSASNGTASINAMTGTWTYTPAANYNGADSFTVTVTDDQGGTETQLINLTITSVNDVPVNTVPSLIATDANTNLSFTGAGKTVSSADVDTEVSNELVTVQLTVTNGTITATATGTGGFAAVSAGAVGSTTFTLSGSEVEIQASMATLQYAPTISFTGDATLTTLATDAAALSDTDITIIRVVQNATTPGFTNLEGMIPASTGLLLNRYASQNVVLVGDGVSDNPATATIDASTLEAAAASGTPIVTRHASGIGRGIIENIAVFDASNTELLSGENSLLVYTGLIYLQANIEYGIAGYVDDALHIELGGKVIVSTNIQANQAGTLASLSLPESGAATFTPTANGYYTLEIYAANLDANGALALNLTANAGVPGNPGIPTEINIQNHALFAGVDDLIAVGGQIGSFVSNTVDGNPDGGYFPLATGVDSVGVSGAAISLAVLPFEITAGDVLTNITISSIPTNVVIGDGVNTFDNNPGAANDGESSLSFTPLSLLNSGAANWDISQLSISGLTSTTTLTIDATASTLTGNDIAAALSGANFTVGILATDYLGTGGNIVDPAIQSTDDSRIVFGLFAGELAANLDTGQILYNAASNASVEGGNGPDVLIGGRGADYSAGGAGDDLIVGGKQADFLVGGEGSDTFAWVAGDRAGAPTDTVFDFTQGPGGDVLDFSGILTGEAAADIADYLSLSGTTITIDIDGSTGGTAYDDLTVELIGLTATTITQLVFDGNIVIGDEQ